MSSSRYLSLTKRRDEEKERQDLATVRDAIDAIIEGYQDLIDGRVVEFKGDLRSALSEIEAREKCGWK